MLDRVVQDLDIGALITRRWPVIALAGLLGLLAAGFYCVFEPTIYESSAEVLVMQKDTAVTANSARVGEGFEQSLGDEVLATHMQIMTSPRIISEALQRGGLYKVESLASIPSAEAGLDESAARRLIDAYVLENLHVGRAGEGPTKDSRVIHLAFQHGSAADSAAVLKSVIDSYQHFVSATVQNAADRALELIDNARSELQGQVKSDDAKYQEFVRQADALVTAGELSNPHKVLVDQFDAQLVSLRLRRNEIMSRKELIEKVLTKGGDDQPNVSNLGFLAVISDADLERLQVLLEVQQGGPISEQFQATQPERTEAARSEYDRLWTLKLKAMELADTVGSQHPDLLEVQRQADELDAYLQKSKQTLGTNARSEPMDPRLLAETYLQLLNFDLAEIDRRETTLQGQIGEERENAKKLVEIAQQASGLYRNLENSQKLYDKVVDRLGDVNLARDYAGFITEVIEPVEMGMPIWPRTPWVLAAGTMLGLITGAMGSLLLEIFGKDRPDTADIVREFSLPVLATMSPCDEQSTSVGTMSMGAKDPTCVASEFNRMWAADTEAFRELRTGILYHTRSMGHPVVQITSPQAHDGKEFVSSGLALALAHIGKKVLLIDCNLQRPLLHRLFSLPNVHGLSTLLAGDSSSHDIVLATEQPNLNVVPFGDCPSYPADLLLSPQFNDFLDTVRKSYDFVLLDTPPVQEQSDSLALATLSDAGVVVIAPTRRSRGVNRLAVDRLRSHGAKLLGAVATPGYPEHVNWACRTAGPTESVVSESARRGQNEVRLTHPEVQPQSQEKN